MSSNFGLSYSEIDELHIINPEKAAHNIALAYISSSSNVKKISNSDEVILSDVLSLSKQYTDAYNYAYNFIVHENKLIRDAE